MEGDEEGATTKKEKGRNKKGVTVTVVVKNLPTGTTHQHLHALCHHLKGVVEVDIPARTAIYRSFIFGFVRFVSLEAAVDGVDKLNGLVVQRRRLSAELGHCHWRNTNHRTVVCDEEQMGDGGGGGGDGGGDEAALLSEEDVNTTIMQLCQRQWYQHRRRQHPHRDLPPFNQIMERVCNLNPSRGEEEEDERVRRVFGSAGGLVDYPRPPASSNTQTHKQPCPPTFDPCIL